MRDAGKENRRAAPSHLGWSQNELARRAEVNHPTLFKIEADQRLNPSISVVVRIARALGTTAEALYGFEARGDAAARRGQQDDDDRRDSPARAQDRAMRRAAARTLSSPRALERAGARVREAPTLPATRPQRNRRLPGRGRSAWRRAVLRSSKSFRRFVGVSTRSRRGVATKKDALESAHRDDQRVGPIVGFVTCPDASSRRVPAGGHFESSAGKVRSRTSCAYASQRLRRECCPTSA